MTELLITYFKVGDGVTREPVAQRCSVKKMFLEISQYSQENACARVSFLKKFRTQPASVTT